MKKLTHLKLPEGPRLLAISNPDRLVWENPNGQVDLFSTHSEVFFSTWPSSGSMRNGLVYELPMPELPTSGSVSSSSPLLKTPTSQLAINGGSQPPEKRKAGGHGPTLADQVEHELPTL